MPPHPHPLVEPLLDLVGVWVGGGTGWLPGDEVFTWRERFEVGHGGTPALWFRQRTTRPDGSPFHAEDGWVRIPPEIQDGGPTSIEMVVAGPTGVLEALAGGVERDGPDGELVLDVSSTIVTSTPAAATVHGTRRRWTLEEGRLRCDFWMATPTHPETFHHLRGTFEPA